MPYPTSEAQLLHLTQAAITDPEIVQGLDDTNLRESDLSEHVKQLAEGIWRSAQGKIDAHDENEKNVMAKRKQVEAEHQAQRPTLLDLPRDRFNDFLQAVAITLTIGIAGASLLSGILEGWRSSFRILITLPFVIMLGTVVVILVLIGRRNLLEGKHNEERFFDLGRKEKEWSASLTDLKKTSGLDQLEIELSAAELEIDKTLTQKINGELRSYLNSQTKLSYETKLRILRAPGLAEVFDKVSTINTSSRASVEFMLNNMPGGSIGIAGPRGAGKTTLLRLFCGKKRVLTELKQMPVLGVLVSAPVQYQARDFILYLFSATCRNFLDYKKVPYDLPHDSDQPLSEAFKRSFPFLKSLRPLWSVCLDFGARLILLSLFLALNMAMLSVLQSWVATDELRAKNTQNATATATPGVTPSTAADATSTPAVSPSPQTNQPNSSELRILQLPFKFFQQLGIPPTSTFFWAGVLTTVFGFVLVVVTGVTIDEYETYRRKRGSVFRAMVRVFLQAFDYVIIPLLRNRQEEYQNIQHEQEEAAARRNVPEADKDLTEVALDWLAKVKFQQSYTSGWSGALKLPIGVEGSMNSARTLAENQLSLPEIVDAYIRFLTRVSQQCKLIIGIDELDKLESDEKAQRFLNEIKSIFGLEHCFYLISVSENAMSSFERRGLPFRDVFDSSFDTIIYVDYLDFTGAQDLIEKRIVGRPIPFFALAYCLSGGLARDMIRIFRNLIELRQANPAKDDLETLCHGLVKADLRAKFRAAAITAKKIDLETEVDVFLERLYEIESAPLSEDLLLKAAQDVFPSYSCDKTSADATNSKDKNNLKHEQLNALREDLGTYIYYLLTIIQFFKNSLSQGDLTKQDEGSTVDYLARARQMLVINSNITRTMLNKFREKHRLAGTFAPHLPLVKTNGTNEGRIPKAIRAGLRSFLSSLEIEKDPI